MRGRIVNSFLNNWVSIDDSDVMLVQFYTFLFVWIQQLGVM